MDHKPHTENAGEKEKHSPAPRQPKSGKQGAGPEWTGEGDSSIERGQRAGEPSKGGGSQWNDEGVKAPQGHREY